MKITEIIATDRPLFHAIRASDLESVRRHGIVPGWISNYSESDPRFVYLADTPERASGFVKGRSVVLRIDVSRLDRKLLMPDEYIEQTPAQQGHFFVYAGTIPFAAVEVA